MFACVSNISSSPQKPMHITMNNSLPLINFHIGLVLEVEDYMHKLVDTGVVMNDVNNNYQLWLMSQYSAMVAEYMQCDINTEYDVVQPLATLDLNITLQANTHGQMIVVILYHISYLFDNKFSLILSFSLGDNISLRIVFGLPTLLTMGVTINLQQGTLACSEFQHIFVLQ